MLATTWAAMKIAPSAGVKSFAETPAGQRGATFRPKPAHSDSSTNSMAMVATAPARTASQLTADCCSSPTWTSTAGAIKSDDRAMTMSRPLLEMVRAEGEQQNDGQRHSEERQKDRSHRVDFPA